MSDNTPKTALLVGPTGLIGRNLLRMLLDNKAYEQVVVIHRRSTGINHLKLTEHVVDFEQPDSYAALVKADDIFCTLGTTIKKAGSKEKFKQVDYQYPMDVAQAGLQNGAKQFLIVTALGADAASMIFYNRVKGEVERDLQSLDYAAIHFFQPSLLLGERDESRFGESFGKIVMQLLSFLFVGRLKRYKAIKGETVAQGMLNAAQQNQTGVYTYPSDKIYELAN